MAFSLNKIMIIGNLGQDAEHRFTNNNISVSSYSVATTHSYKGKDENWVNETTWHNVVSFGLSDFFKEGLKKGKKVYVEGRLSKRSYQDKEGNTKYVTEIVSEKLILLESKSDSSDQSDFTNAKSSPDSSEVTDDDLPF